MNIFFIPSWYPSEDAPLAGIFSKEQAESFSRHYKNAKLGISLWGQKSESNLLWAKDPVKNIRKLLHYRKQQAYEKQLTLNYWEFYTPALTWSDKLLNGNLENIISANEKNLKKFSAIAGEVSLIHAHVAFPAGYIAMELARKYQIPYLITEQMSPFPFACYTSRGQIMQKVLLPLQKANKVIAISPHAAADVKSKTAVSPICIPNPVDENIFSPGPSLSNDPPFTFFTLGRMVPQKGISDLLEAISLVKRKEVHFRIGGEGEHKQQYQQQAEKLGVANRIEWLGSLSRTEAAKEFQQCHAFVLSSIHESMGVVYAEALACGKPIIATRCGGPEYIVNQSNGLLTDVSNPLQLAKVMDLMISNYALYNPQLIRADFLKRFSSASVSKQLYKVYEDIKVK
jgi:glycosyltransferase involved in cell wall biosynthesis